VTTIDPEADKDQFATQFRSTQAFVEVQRLITLDDLWTAQLQAISQLPPDVRMKQYHPLSQLVEEMSTGLSAIRHYAHGIGLTLASSSVSDHDFDEALRSLGRSAATSITRAPEQLIETLRSGLEGVSPKDAAIYACNYVYWNADNEAGFLRAKLDQIERGEAPTGDLSHTFRCAVTLLGVAAGVGLAIVTGGSVVVIALGVAVPVITAVGEFCDHCLKVVAQLRSAPPLPTPVLPPTTQPAQAFAPHIPGPPIVDGIDEEQPGRVRIGGLWISL